MRNVYVFPGIRKSPGTISQHQEQFATRPTILKNVYVRHGEGIIATMLNDLLGEIPRSHVGSLSGARPPDYKVRSRWSRKTRSI